jgi:exonuclease SbcC
MKMRVARLTIENFLGIAECELMPGKITVISGANRQGKTSILKALETAFAGGGDLSDRIRTDTNKATILVELDDGVTINRKLTAAGNYVAVSKDGFERKGPQSWLNELIGEGTLSFNPIAFFTAKPDRQREMMLSAIPISVTPENLQDWFGTDFGIETDRHGLEVLADVEKLVYENRRDANAVVKGVKGRAEALAEKVPDDFDAGAWREADVSALNEQIRAAGQAQEREQNLRAKLAEWIQRQAYNADKKAALLAQIEELERDDEVCRLTAAELKADLAALEIPDASEAQQRLSEYSDAQRTLADVDALEQARSELADAEQTAARYDQLVEQVRTKPDELLRAADVPIEGLEIKPDAILLNGVEIQNLSGSERLLLALDVVRAVNRDFGIICIDGAEALDDETFDLLLTHIQDPSDDFQYFITHVTTGGLHVGDLSLEYSGAPADANGQTAIPVV